jgi:serine/threonine-protein kinase
MPLQIGETFAGYRILQLLGSGGMGEVYLVQHPRLPRHDALKVLRPEVSSDPSFRERFIREADLAAGLRHPHIVGIHDRGEDDGQLWIAMDYVDGTDLAYQMAQRYPAGMPVDLVVPIITAVASTLDYAHKKASCIETSSPPTSSSPTSTPTSGGSSSPTSVSPGLLMTPAAIRPQT